MGDLLTISDYAQMLGVTRQAVYNACHRKQVFKENKLIDTEHPINVAYAAKVGQRMSRKGELKKERKARGEFVQAKRKLKAVTQDKKETKEIAKQVIEQSDGDPNTAYAVVNNFVGELLGQKELEEIRVKKITADLKSLEYSKKLEALVDVESIQRLFLPFFDIIMTELTHMPEEASDMIYQRARNAEHPARAIEEELSSRIESIIKKAKAALEKIEPEPGKDRKYIMIEN